MSYFNIVCDSCGRGVQGITWVNGMKFCAKCYQETFGASKDWKLLDKDKTIAEQQQRIAELEEQLKNAVILEPDHYVIITNGWKNKKYGVALSQQRVQHNYIQETDGRMGCYVPCIEFGKFETKEEALAKLEELKGE